jgi:hypothetical protein
VFDAPGSKPEGTALGKPAGINLLDYGCIRTFPTKFVQGVIDLYTGLKTGRRDLVVHAYETWGFTGLSSELIDVLNIWARFIYGPLLDDRETRDREGTTPGQYGRKEAFTVHKALKEKGPVRVPREFVFMDRAAIGLGGVFLHLAARLNWHDIFNETIEGFTMEAVGARQQAAFEAARVRCRCFLRLALRVFTGAPRGLCFTLKIAAAGFTVRRSAKDPAGSVHCAATSTMPRFPLHCSRRSQPLQQIGAPWLSPGNERG